MPSIEFDLLNSTLVMGSLHDVKKSVDTLGRAGEKIRNQLFFFDSSVCSVETMQSDLQHIVDRQEIESESIDSLIEETEDFFDLVVRSDFKAGSKISERKDDFYKKYSYLKPDCEKNVWEKICDRFSDAIEWCAEHWDIITAVLVVIAVIAVAVVAVVCFPFGAAAVLTAAAAGAILGVAGQFVGDVVKFVMTGKWDTNIIKYIGAALGGACGGMITLISGGNAHLGNLVGTAVSTLFTNSVENFTGVENHSFLGTMFETGVDAGFSYFLSRTLGDSGSKAVKNPVEETIIKKVSSEAGDTLVSGAIGGVYDLTKNFFKDNAKEIISAESQFASGLHTIIKSDVSTKPFRISDFNISLKFDFSSIQTLSVSGISAFDTMEFGF